MKEEVLESGSGLKSFECGTGFTTSVESKFDDLYSSKVSLKDQHDVNHTRFKYSEEVVLEVTSTLDDLPSPSIM